MKYLNTSELEYLSTKELLEIKKKLIVRRDELIEECKEWPSQFKKVIIELEERVSMLELDLLEAEEDRINGDWHKTTIN